MNNVRSFQMALGVVAVSLMLSAAVTGCVAGEPGTAPAEVASAAQASVVVKAGSVERLAQGETLAVDLRDSAAVEFDTSEGAIDFSRVEMTSADGSTLPASEWLAKQAQADPRIDAESLMENGFALFQNAEAAALYKSAREGEGTASPGHPHRSDALTICVIIVGDSYIIVGCVRLN